jgi:N-acetylmuramoyl-L-alanine amidase
VILMFKIVLDAGHGPETPGKRTPDGSMREFHFNSVVANYVKEQLELYENVEVKFTHVQDYDVSLTKRTDKANEWKADVFVSIHTNAYGAGGWNSVEGIETFTYITKPQEAYGLAAEVQNQLLRETSRVNRGVKGANFHVLRESDMTAILVECGFMTNIEEAELLKTDGYRRKCAKAIVQGLVNYYNLKKKKEGSQELSLSAKKTTIIDDGREYEGFIVDGRTYAPVRSIAESAGRQVDWNGKNVILK